MNTAKYLLTLGMLLCGQSYLLAQRSLQYYPDGQDLVCVNGSNRYTRPLYGSETGFRLETSDRPVFATYSGKNSRNIALRLNYGETSLSLDSTTWCEARYQGGIRRYELTDQRWPEGAKLKVAVQLGYDDEYALWQICATGFGTDVTLDARSCNIANTKMYRSGDLGTDARDKFEANTKPDAIQTCSTSLTDGFTYLYYKNVDTLLFMEQQAGEVLWAAIDAERHTRMDRIEFSTPDPFINPLGSILMAAADGLWDGESWLHGCNGWRTPLAGWRAAYVGDVVGWTERSLSHFRNYANSMVTKVPNTLPHPAMDTLCNLARAEEKWGTPMYSNGYISRKPNCDTIMHHYDMNLNYVDELLWHLQYDADTAQLKEFWPLIKMHLAWEKRNFDPDDDHLYDAYCCIWASDALYYNSGAVTHSSAYNYRGNRLAARIAQILGEDSAPYQQEADAILKAMNQQLWMNKAGHWAEYRDFMGLKRLHPSAALWSIYTPIDCEACTPKQAYQATRYVDREIPHIGIKFNLTAPEGLSVDNEAWQKAVATLKGKQFSTVSTSNWHPYVWSTNNIAHEEVANMALAYMQAGRAGEGFNLLKSDLLDEMYLGACPGNFGQISFYDKARQEAYRDFGDNVGITSRALVNGLFGIRPAALFGQCILQPAFPTDWKEASIRTPYLSYTYKVEGDEEVFVIDQNFSRPLKIVVRRMGPDGLPMDAEGTDEAHQEIRIIRHYTKPAVNVMAEFKKTKDKANKVEYICAMGLDEVSFDAEDRHTYINLGKWYNASVSDIFKNKYMSPRSPYTTLQIPTQGIGDWCSPNETAEIDDKGLRSLISYDGLFDTGLGLKLRMPEYGHNIVYTSKWDNYPDTVSIPMKGRAAYAYLLMAGSTNSMQSRIDNGLVVMRYTNGSADTLHLENPINWCPIEQDYYTDDAAFWSSPIRPYRVHLFSGTTSRDLTKALRESLKPRTSIYCGAATLLKMPLDPKRKLKELQIITLSNDVVIGLMAVTLEQ